MKGEHIIMKKMISFLLAAALMLSTTALAEGIDYMALVNKQQQLPEGWEDALEIIRVKNSVGEDVEVEKKTYEAYLALAEELEREDGIHTELDSGRRSVAEQQRIWDNFIVKYGEEYTRKTVAVPGYSEHQTGLAIDLYFITADGTTVYYNEDLTKEEYFGIWDKIHEKLAKYGFILRYLKGKEAITGYDYEPWHIRYIDDPAVAQEIMEKGITLEEYLGKAAALPAYVYPFADENPVMAAATEYLVTADLGYETPEGGVLIPAPIVLKEEVGETEATLWGDFWIFAYQLNGNILECTAGGENSGVMKLEKKDGAWNVISLEVAEDGENFADSIRAFANGDEELEKEYYLASDAMDGYLPQSRRSFIVEYVNANHLDIVAYQDYGWEPVDITM